MLIWQLALLQAAARGAAPLEPLPPFIGEGFVTSDAYEDTREFTPLEDALAAYAATVYPALETAGSKQELSHILHEAARPVVEAAGARSKPELELLDLDAAVALEAEAIPPDSNLGQFARDRLREMAVLPFTPVT